MSNPKLIPELYCEDIENTKRFYTEILGFTIKYERPEEQFVYFTFEGADMMVEGINGAGRRWLTGNMEKPFGRGVNFQWTVSDVEALYSRVKQKSINSIYLEIETKHYVCGSETSRQQQFIVQDPDGYLIRFCCDT